MEFFVVLFFVLGGLILKSAAERSVEKTSSEDAQKARDYVEELKRRNGAPARNVRQPRPFVRSASESHSARGAVRGKDFSGKKLSGEIAATPEKRPRKRDVSPARERTAQPPVSPHSPDGESRLSDVDADLSAAFESLQSAPDNAVGGISDSEKFSDTCKVSAAQRLGLDSADSLKRAFAASEILGKPKSLRDDWV